MQDRIGMLHHGEGGFVWYCVMRFASLECERVRCSRAGAASQGGLLTSSVCGCSSVLHAPRMRDMRCTE